MEIDPEIQAIRDAWAAMEHLETAAKRRVVGYLELRIDQENREATGDVEPSHFPAELGDEWRVGFSQWIASGATDAYSHWIMVSAALLSWENPGRELTSREIHQPIKDAGHSVGNISAHLNSLANRKGRQKWIIQTSRSHGKHRHKKYAVTDAGRDEAARLLSQK